jgi:hypothetical protein
MLTTAPRTPVPIAAPAPRTPAARRRDSVPTPSASNRLRSMRPAIGLGSMASSGSPLPVLVQTTLEKSFNVELGSVRVHAGQHAVDSSRSMSARAFTFGHHIFLGSGEHATDLGLMAHETAHVVQQTGGATVQTYREGSDDVLEREAASAADAVRRGSSFRVKGRTGSARVQRLGVSDALDYFADQANLIPGFRMLTIVLGVNPINMSRVERNAANILRALIELLPLGGLITQALDNSGVFEKVGTWVEQQIQTLGLVGSAIKKAVTDFLVSLGLSDLLNFGGIWNRAKRIFTDPADRIINFGKGLVTGIIKFVKDAILHPIAKLAEGTAGYDLLKGVLGKDPITDDPVARTPETLIAPFMKLIGEEEIWENMKKANAIQRAWAWFQGALSGLKDFIAQVPALFVAAFNALELADIVLVPRAFAKLAGVFGGFLAKFTSWAGSTIWNLLEIIFDVVSPGALSYIKKTGAALKSILKNPLPFVGNLVKAAKLGFTNFADNILTHLKAGLIDWLTGSLPGIYIPQALTLQEIGKFVLSVLGISWAQIRGKIVKVLGPNGEKIMVALETGFDIVVAFVKGGTVAVWDVIKEKLANLKDMVIGGITDFVVDTVVKKAIPKVIGMFIPGVGFIPAIISIYDTIMVFVTKISKIIQVVTGFIDSIVAIAGGVIDAAAKRVETTLAGLLSLAINFLAGFVGLGKVADKVVGVLEKVRAAVDKAIDAAINWIVGKAKALFASLFGKKAEDAEKPDTRTDADKMRDLEAAIREVESLLDSEDTTEDQVRAKLPAIKHKYRLGDLATVDNADDTFQVEGRVNPGKKSKKGSRNRYVMMKDDKPYLRPKYRGSFMIRTRLYRSGGGYGSSTTAKKDAIVARKTRFDSPYYGKFWEPKKGRQPVPLTGPTAPTIDHDPPVVKHWNIKGYNTDQPTRRAFFTLEDAIVMVLPQNENSSLGAKGEGTYRDDLGANFKAPGEE